MAAGTFTELIGMQNDKDHHHMFHAKSVSVCDTNILSIHIGRTSTKKGLANRFVHEPSVNLSCGIMIDANFVPFTDLLATQSLQRPSN